MCVCVCVCVCVCAGGSISPSTTVSLCVCVCVCAASEDYLDLSDPDSMFVTSPELTFTFITTYFLVHLIPPLALPPQSLSLTHSFSLVPTAAFVIDR